MKDRGEERSLGARRSENVFSVVVGKRRGKEKVLKVCEEEG
jgi:hypothetical protein